MNIEEFNFLEGEVLLINKPYKWTSFDVINKIRCLIKYNLGIKKIKIGHAGTLDPLASGLLILCSGAYTKKIESYQAQEKEYTGKFFLGATTPSFDLETEVDFEFPTSHLNEDFIKKSTSQFTGEIMQVPPIFSAKKIGGERAYEFARSGKEITLPANTVTISVFEITNIELPYISFRVVCSKGTYIRSLARDFGKSLNSGAYLAELCRTRIGNFELKDAINLSDFESLFPLRKNNFG
ncbi:MAG: tRNA pseudouridine(55) synthase TruB [Bacteroidales bacterium]|nr:tRNA pseudouridine(55) synthase TruB [Bacteroidales bacterium]